MNKGVLLLVSLAFLLVGCRTVRDKSDRSLTHSVGMDFRPVEKGLKSYSYELKDYEAFRKAINPSNAYVDGMTHLRTDFGTFKREDGEAECIVGLSTPQMDYMDKHKKIGFAVQPSTPGMMKGVYQSQIYFIYQPENSKTKDQFLVICTHPDRPVNMSDAALVLGDFIKFTSASEDTPTYDVCCRCKTDIYRSESNGKDTLLLKDQIRSFLMMDSNDSVCKNSLDYKRRNPLRPGDAGYKIKENRFYMLTQCDEASLSECSGQYIDEIDEEVKAKKQAALDALKLL